MIWLGREKGPFLVQLLSLVLPLVVIPVTCNAFFSTLDDQLNLYLGSFQQVLLQNTSVFLGVGKEKTLCSLDLKQCEKTGQNRESKAAP